MRVFISHSSPDKPAVRILVAALTERGIECWLDEQEIGPRDDFVRRINEGLDGAAAGLVVFSTNSAGSHWVSAEVSYLLYAHFSEGKALIPVVLGNAADVRSLIPPLARPILRWKIERRH